MLLRSESKMIIKPTNNHKSIIIDQVLLDINYIIGYINRRGATRDKNLAA